VGCHGYEISLKERYTQEAPTAINPKHEYRNSKFVSDFGFIIITVPSIENLQAASGPPKAI
jgi:hypothetical protein